MIGQMPPLFKGQRLRATGVGVLDVNAVEAQQRKTDRKGARRPSAGAGKDLFQPGWAFNGWLAC